MAIPSYPGKGAFLKSDLWQGVEVTREALELVSGRIALHSLTDAQIVPGGNVAGEPRDTVTLASSSLIAEAATSDAARPPMTIFVSARTSFAKEREALERYARHCPVPIEWNRARIFADPPPPALLEAAFDEHGVSGEIHVPFEAPDRSLIELVTHGVVVASEWLRPPGLQVTGWVRNDGFRKTISQMGVVKDAFYLQAMGVLTLQSSRFLKEAVTRAAGGAADCGRLLLDGDLRAVWMPWDSGGIGDRLGALIASGRARSDPSVQAVRQQSALVAALRMACLLRRDDIVVGHSKDGLAELLADAPVLYDGGGRPLSLRPLMAQARWLGHVPFVDGEPGLPAGPLTAAWTPRGADRAFLQAFFPDQAKPLKADAAAGIDPAARPILDDPNLLVKVPFMSGPVSGEVGLSLNPHPRRTRLRWIGARGPLGVSAWELRGLRLEAVVHHPDLQSLPREDQPGTAVSRALAAVLSTAAPLYQLLSRDYRPEEDTPRMALTREHLLDLLRLAFDARTLDTPSQPWLAALDLFLDAKGRRVSLEDLRRRSADGGKTTVRASVHPERLQALVAGYPDHVRMLFFGSERVEIYGPPAVSAVPETAKPLAPKPPWPTPKPPPPSPDAALVMPKTARVELPLPAPDDLVIDPAQGLRSWLAALKLRGASQLPDAAVRALRLVERGRGPLLRLQPDTAWELDALNPMVKSLAGLPPGDATPYLASLTYSALNRALAGLTDEQDARFVEALAAMALEAYGG